MPVEVKLRKGEAMEKALRRLKKKLDREGVIRDIRQKRYFEKPSEIKRRKKASLEERPSRGPADAPVTPTLEVISPELTAVRLRRMLAAVFMKAGRELDAEMELALLPVEARSL